MPTGYKVAGGADLDSMFMAGSGGTATGYKVAGGADLSSVFQPYTQGAQVAATGYKIAGGADFSTRFQNINVPLFTVDVKDYYVAWARANGCSVSIDLLPDGSVTIRRSGQPNTYDTWGTPVGGTPGAQYWARFTYSGDAISAGGTGTGTWISMAVGNSYANLVCLIPGQRLESHVTLQIATDSVGSNIVDTSYPIMIAEWVV